MDENTLAEQDEAQREELSNDLVLSLSLSLPATDTDGAPAVAAAAVVRARPVLISSTERAQRLFRRRPDTICSAHDFCQAALE